MKAQNGILFSTDRLNIRFAEEQDAVLFSRLWNNPDVMKYVGFPKGLNKSVDDVRQQIRNQKNQNEFKRLLFVELCLSGEKIGECFMEEPDSDGIAKTDVKLLPEFWGNKYGEEIKQALVEYLFSHTECNAIEGGPNVENAASIKMQEGVGGIRTSEGTYEFPESMHDFTCPVHYYIYRVYRSDWEARINKP